MHALIAAGVGIAAYAAMGFGYYLLSFVTGYVSWVGSMETLALWTPVMALLYLVGCAGAPFSEGRSAVPAAIGIFIMPWVAYAWSNVGEIGAILYYGPPIFGVVLMALVTAKPASRGVAPGAPARPPTGVA